MKKEHIENFYNNLLKDFENAKIYPTKDELLKIGFKEISHFTKGQILNFNLGRRRFLSITSLGTANEMIYIIELQEDCDNTITDLICLHNYDYDGFLTIRKLKHLISGITGIEFLPQIKSKNY